jgi:enoyl-CoA hydratase/carnithine racemase
MTGLAVPELVLTEPEPGIYELVFDRPRHRNALTEEMMRALGTVAEQVNLDRRASALIVRGAGGSFCAGADLSVVDERRRADEPWRWPPLMGREADLLADCEVATIAVVDGAAVGLGMGLALGCDVCVMEPQGYFAEAHLALGLTPTAMCWWLPRMAGLQRAGDIVLTGRRVYGEEAVGIGLAARLAGRGDGRSLAMEVAREVAAKPPVMSRFAKLALRLAQDQPRMTDVRRFGALANRLHRSLGS